MLTITEKIIAKILANRIKVIANRIVYSQQTGFLPGRDIMDNLLTFRLAQDLSKLHKKPLLYLKLDFMKAYDRVSHSFLWGVLQALGFCEKSIMFIKGLVTRAQSKVHVNGSLTPDIDIGRGVRQGCPISSLLFTFTTQVLMSMINHRISTGALQGFHLSDGSRLCQQLFADDIGLYLEATEGEFKAARDVIQHFERISGAALNLSKSLIIPIYFTDGIFPTWLKDTGCKISQVGEICEYLGCPIGYRVTPAQEVDYLVNKLRKKLSSG